MNYTTSTDNGSTWATPTEEIDAITVNFISATIYERDHYTVLAYVYDDGGVQKYNEKILNIGGAGGIVTELTGTEVTALLDNFTATLKGLAPLSGGGTTNFLRADGTWAAPPGGGGDKIYRIGHTYAIGGQIKVPAGNNDFIVPFFVSFAAGQTANLVKARHQIESGTSATVKLQRNAGDITGYTGITVNTTASDTTQTQALSDNDELSLIVTGVSGTPREMSFTLFIEYTQ